MSLRFYFPLVQPDLRAGVGLIAAFLLTQLCLHAQSVRWDPPRGTLAVGQTSELQLVFEDCTPEQTIPIPKVDGLAIQATGRATSVSVINFQRSDSVTVTFAVHLSKKQRVTIPSFEVNTNKGRLRTPVATYEGGDATLGGTGIALETAASSRIVAVPASVWAGEVFALTYTIDAAHSYSPDFGRGQFEWNAEPLVAEEWSRPEPFSARAGADTRDGFVYRTRAIARTPGGTRLNAAHQLLNLGVGVTGFGFFQQRQFQQFSITSSAPLLEVKPLPPAPAGFTGAVGALKLTSKVVPATAAVGEPVTWTLELTGVANWPDITGLPPREVSRDFQVVSPQAKRTPVEGKLFEATLAEDVVLVPTKPGNYQLGPLTFTYFDPKLGAYQTITTQATDVAITAPIASAATPTPASSAAMEESKVENPKSKILPAPLPDALPREPLSGGKIASVPLTGGQVFIWLLPSGGALALFWLWLALGHARLTDPARARRETHARLNALLAKITPTADKATLRPQLLQWQHEMTFLLGIPHAAPSPATAQLKTQPAKLQTLWAESDRALYSENSPLPADWPARAQSTLVENIVPRFSALRLFRPQNLFPFFAFALLLALVDPSGSIAAEPPSPKSEPAVDPAAAYRAGNFTSAEKSWRAVLATNPTDTAARHNLSLALAQQDRWDEASAHASVAFVQSPGQEPIRAQFALTAEKSGHIAGPLAGFLQPSTSLAVARLNSPRAWQNVLIGSFFTGVLGLAILLWSGYRRLSKAWITIAGAVIGLSLGAAIAGIIGWKTYGEAADARAVIVWRTGLLRSIPTEADTAQKTSTLSAGALALADKSFLGWQHLTFEAGQTGWVRKDEIVPLWK